MAGRGGDHQRRRSAEGARRSTRQVHRRGHARRLRVPADAALAGARHERARSIIMKHAFVLAATVIAVVGGAAVAAQTCRSPATLLNPPADSWPTYHGDYSGKRHSTLSAITPANVHQLTLAWAFQTNSPQGVKATPILVERRDLSVGARQLVGHRRPHRASALALHVSEERRLPHRSSRRRRLSGLRLSDDARRASPRARRAHRQGALERRDCRREARLLVDERAAADSQSSDRRRLRRFRQSAGHPEVVRSGDGRAAVDVLQHAARPAMPRRRAAARPAVRCG